MGDAINGMTITGAIISTAAEGSRFVADGSGARLINVAPRLIGTATIVAATGVITTSAVHGLAVGNAVWLGPITSTTGIAEDTVYYVITVPSTTSFTLSIERDGIPLILTTNGSSTSVTTYGTETPVISLPTDGSDANSSGLLIQTV